MRILAAALLLLASCGAPPVPSPEDERVLRPIPDAPEAARPHLERGDETFVRASAAQRGDDGAAALDLYRRARSSYLQAEALCGGFIPPPLIDRATECVNRIAALQRQVHTNK